MIFKKSFFIRLLCVLIPISSHGQEIKNVGKIGFTFSVPFGNNFNYYDYEVQKPQSSFGIGGIGVSVFRQGKRSKVSWSSGVIAAGSLMESFGVWTSVAAVFSDVLYYQKAYKGAYLVGGLNFVNYLFSLNSTTDNVKEYHKQDKTVGVTAGVEYQIFRGIGAGIFYRPTLYSFGTTSYKHTISIEVNYSIVPKKRKGHSRR